MAACASRCPASVVVTTTTDGGSTSSRIDRRASARPEADVIKKLGVIASGASPASIGVRRRARRICASRKASMSSDSRSIVPTRIMSSGESPRSACRVSPILSARISSRLKTTRTCSCCRLMAASLRSASRSAAVPVTMATGPAAKTRRARVAEVTGTTRRLSSASSKRACSAALSACSTVGVITRQAGEATPCIRRLRSMPGRMAAVIIRISAGPCSTTCWLRVAPGDVSSRSCSPTPHPIDCRSAWPPNGQ